jgi:hypothetical protein
MSKKVLLDQVYRLQIQMRLSCDLTSFLNLVDMAEDKADVEVIQCLQLPESHSPGIPPDCYVSADGHVERVVGDNAALRERYRKERSERGNFGKGKRNYVPGALYDKIPPECLIIDVGIEGGSRNFDIVVGVQGGGAPNFSILEESVVEIRYAPTSTDWRLNPLQRLCNDASSTCRNQVRKNRDLGRMFGFGQKYDPYQKKMNEFAGNADVKEGLLASASEAVLSRVAREFPSVTRVLQDAEADAGAVRCECMGGTNFRRFLANSLFISEDLGNAPHEDINDACKCICVWKETIDGISKNWYFILPDMIGQYYVKGDDGVEHLRSFTGIAIKLYDGIIISWDGRIICHGTTLTKTGSSMCHTYGCVFVAKSTVVQQTASFKRTAADVVGGG